MNFILQKQTIRKSVLEIRNRLPANEQMIASRAIIERIVALDEYQQATTVLGHMNIGSEFASEIWVNLALAEGKRMVLPRVNHHTNQLDLYLVEDLEIQLAVGLWGIREPVVERCKRLNTLNEVEFALLPGIAFSRTGARLGYGGGFYDKLLARFPHQPTLVTGAFALQLVEEIPQESTDCRLEWLVTEQETIHCTAVE